MTNVALILSVVAVLPECDGSSIVIVVTAAGVVGVAVGVVVGAWVFGGLWEAHAVSPENNFQIKLHPNMPSSILIAFLSKLQGRQSLIKRYILELYLLALALPRVWPLTWPWGPISHWWRPEDWVRNLPESEEIRDHRPAGPAPAPRRSKPSPRPPRCPPRSLGCCYCWRCCCCCRCHSGGCCCASFSGKNCNTGESVGRKLSAKLTRKQMMRHSILPKVFCVGYFCILHA